MLAPALLLTGVLFYGGLLAGIVRSFGVVPAIGLTEPTLDAYRSLLASSEVRASLALSLAIAGLSAAISVVIGIGAALLLRRLAPGRVLIRLLFQLNLAVPHLVGALGFLYLLSQSGSFARIAAAGGLIAAPAEFPALVHDPAAIGIVLAYVWKEVPFVGLVVLASLQSIGADYEAAARTLGAGRWQTFRHVLLPMILPGALSAGVVVFAYAFGAYEVPAVLGRSQPEALPILAWRRFTDPDLATRPEAMAIAVLIAAVGAALVAGQVALARRRIRP